MPDETIRVLLADDHAVVRAGLRAVLNAAKDISVVGEAGTGREAIAYTSLLKPDVVVMDLSMPDIDGTAATRTIAASGSRTRVLVLSMHAEEDYLVPVMEAGASGYLVKTDADKDLITAVRAVARGNVYLRPAAAMVLARTIATKESPQHDRRQYERLTPRERDVLRLVGSGYSAPEIGARLGISPKTVDTYKQRIHEKLDLRHRSQYVQFALKLGLLVLD